MDSTIEKFQNSNAMLSLSTEIDEIFKERLRKIEEQNSNEKNKQVEKKTLAII
jgi:hypothetical protein